MAIQALIALLLSVFLQAGAPHDHQATLDKIGTVHFSTSCNGAAQRPFDRGVALLHSFEFAAAIDSFDATLAADPSCAVAEWGVALSRWGNPFAAGVRGAGQVRQGLEAIERARAIG